MLIALGRQRIVASVWIAESAVNLALSVVLVRRYGLTGVAVGTAIPLAIGHLGIFFPMACRSVGLTIGEGVRRMFGPALIGLVPASLAVVAFRSTLIGPMPLRLLLPQVAIVLAVYAAAAFTAWARTNRDGQIKERAGVAPAPALVIERS